MNANYFRAVLPFAAAGLKTDNLSGVIYGNYSGYNVTITPIQGGKTFQLSFFVKRGVDMPSAAEMQQLARVNKSLFFGAVTENYRVDFNVKSAAFGIANTVNKKLMPALAAAAAFLSAAAGKPAAEPAAAPKTQAAITYIICPPCCATPALSPLRRNTRLHAAKTSKRAL